MKKAPRISKYIIPLLLLSTCFSVGFSSWKIYSENNYIDTEIGKKGDDAVAYIKDGENKTYYTSLEKAIDVANSKSSNIDVWVIPGTVYTLESNKLKTITIKSNVTLQLPFQDEIVFDVFKGSGTTYDPKGSETVSSTIALDDPSMYLRTQITLDSNIKLDNYGTINIGGVIGSEGGSKGPCGQTCSFYCEIVCSQIDGKNGVEAQISNYGIIENQGSITSNSADALGIENMSGSTFKSVMVIGENRGGSALLKLGSLKIDKTITFDCSPFNTVYMPNGTTNIKCNKGSTVLGIGNMYGGSSNNRVEVPLYGDSDGYLIQSTGGYIISRYINNGSKQCQDIDLFGDHAINYMKLPISVTVVGEIAVNGTVITDGVLFPLSYLNDVSFNSIDGAKANVTSSQDIKVLPGGKLTVGENVSFSIGKLAVYDSSFVDPLTNGVTYPSIKEDGLFVLSGDASIDNLGGYVTIGKENATLKINSSNSVTSKQIEGNPANAKCKDFTFNAESTFSKDNGVTTNVDKLVSGTLYKSIKGSLEKLYFPVKRKISIIAVSNSRSMGFGHYVYNFPTFDVFVAEDASGLNEVKIDTLCSVDSKVNGSLIQSNLSITFADGTMEGYYLKISKGSNCDSIAGFEFNKYIKITGDTEITITKNK